MSQEIKVLSKQNVIAINGIEYYHHINGGGLVSRDSVVDRSAYVSYLSIIGPSSIIRGNVEIKESIIENAIISGNVKISANCRILGGIISGNVQINDGVIIEGHPIIIEDVKIYEKSIIMGSATIKGYSVIKGSTVISGNSKIEGFSVINDSKISGNAHIINSDISCKEINEGIIKNKILEGRREN